MAAHGKERTRTKPNDAKNRPRRGRPKVCVLCAQQVRWVDYKDTNLLRRFMTDRGKIKARANTGTCRQHQRGVAIAIKTARELAMLPYQVRTLAADKSAGRRGREPGRTGDRPPDTDAASAPPADDSQSAPEVRSDIAAAVPVGGVGVPSPDSAATSPGTASLADLQIY
jgi:small subunit ribosomal protein S18